MKITSKTMFIALVLLMLSIPLCAHASEVTEKVRSTVDGVLAILKEQSLQGPGKKEERRARIRSLIVTCFSYEEMSRLSLAKHWSERSAPEKKEFVSLFSDLIENAYIEKIERYTDEKILYVDEKRKNEKALVKTTIISKGTEIPINYKLFRSEGNDWMVYDIVIEGVSLVRNYRSQFSSTIRSSSYEELVKQLKEKVGKR